MTTTRNGTTPTAREYLRVSLDRSGRARSLDEQHDDNAATAEREGWTLGTPYRDESVSASRYSKKVRDGFAELMADLDSGRFGASVLIIWESSRGSRRAGEWCDLIDICAERGVAIHVTTHGRTYDPTNGRDRRTLQEDAVDSEYESSKVSLRAKRAAAANAADGKPHGPVAYGYRRTYDGHTRRYIGQEPHPDEAPVVAELFDRVIKGHSLRSITADLAERGIQKRSGGPFSGAHLRSLLLNPTYAGLRVHDPGRNGVRGTQRPAALSTDARIVPGAWPGIVSEADYYAVQRILTNPTRRTTRPGRGVHLLSMIARCAECDSRLAATNRARRREYQCHERGCVRVDADELDSIAEKAMLKWLARADIHEALAAGNDDQNAEIENVRAEIASLRTRLDELADAVADGSVSLTLAARTEPQLLERLRAAEARERELQTPSALRGLITPGKNVAAAWGKSPMSTRRAVARILLAPDLLGTLVAHRRPEGRRGGGATMPVVERIDWLRSTDAAK
ncbi:recombinase family protein [Pseudonocardia sp. C8]|uniref:recombinase family protein n=1 Tax=Pseudonocardia sp. C8 TaxID=2762759 RepID=UPI001642FEC0|nr:recombinase family protein [Pseudonocardia sp. C8]MBC3193845.1 recombinase family protein [Pseudonocardia sp. C8]